MMIFDLPITPVRILFLAIIVAAVVQWIKLWLPLVNGWAALAMNALMTTLAFYACFRFTLTWTLLAAYLLIGLAAAGVHGTATKISDHPSQRDNPTPSGTPRQNYDKLD